MINKDLSKLFNKHLIQDLIVLVGLTLALIIYSPFLLSAENTQIAVIYPESHARANQLYKTIIKSMLSTNQVTIHRYQFTLKNDTTKLNQWLTNENVDAAIFLGEKGIAFSKKLSLNIPIITGAHIGLQAERPAVSLTAEPAQLFSTLKKLRPNIKTVNVIYSASNNSWLIKNARRAALQNNIVLKAIKIDDIHASGPALSKMVQQLDVINDSVWLPHDAAIPVKSLLPQLLMQAWKKDITIFSGNPYHVQQGTLFALYPNYSKLGIQLIELTLKKLKHKDLQGYEPSRYLNSAINVRTASHLGIHLTDEQLENYKLIFSAE